MVGSSRDKGKIKMILDPGVVFGNALHPTTRDSLIALCEIFKKGLFLVSLILVPERGSLL